MIVGYSPFLGVIEKSKFRFSFQAMKRKGYTGFLSDTRQAKEAMEARASFFEVRKGYPGKKTSSKGSLLTWLILFWVLLW